MRIPATLGLMAAAVIFSSPAAAAEEGPTIEFYGTLLPFFENVGTSGATPPGTIFVTAGEEFHPVNGGTTGVNHDRRFRMTSGTSNLGFRGTLPIIPEFKLIWQVESPTPIDGDGPNNLASRNSHVGFTGNWGTLVYGNWDTPMKWVTVTSVNPIKGGYVADAIAVIGAPGASTPAFNPDPATLATYRPPANRAGFFRHETNSVQYWTPTIAGFSARVMFTSNEHRLAYIEGSNDYIGINPWLGSGYIGWDNSWLRLRYSYEYHNDYFGTGNVGGPGPGQDNRSSHDSGHLALAMVTLNGDSDYKTRIVVMGDRLHYHTRDSTEIGQLSGVTDLSRTAVYGLVQQTFGDHNIWASYGEASAGECHVRSSPRVPCSTVGMGAYYLSGGYLYSFNQGSGVFLAAYAMYNDAAARYSPFPYLEARPNNQGASSLPNLLEISHGSDTLGFGLGFVHQFTAPLLGGGGDQTAKSMEVKEEAPPPPQKKAAPAPPAKKAAAEPEEPEAPAADEEEEAPPAADAEANKDLAEEPEGDAPAEE